MSKKKFRYHQIADDIRSQIQAGYLNKGDFLVSEKELCLQYNSSRNTLRQALDILMKEGLLIKMVGRGTMVAEPPPRLQEDPPPLLVLCPNSSVFTDKALQLLIHSFNALYPRVSVNVLRVDAPDRLDPKGWMKLGIQPDLVLIWDRDYYEVDLNDFLPLSDTVDAPSDYPILNEAFLTDGIPYAIPVTFSPVFLVCHRTVFRERGVPLPDKPWTFDEFVSVAKTLTRDENGDGIPDVYGFGVSSSWSRWPVFAFANGFRFEKEDGSVDESRLIHELRFLQRLLYRDRISPIATIEDFSLIHQLFEEGRIAMQLTTAFTTPFASERERYHVAPLPFNPGIPGGRLLIANGFMISKYSKNIPMAKHFIRTAVSHAVQEQLTKETGLFSIRDRINRQWITDDEANALGLTEEGLRSSRFLSQIVPSGRALSAISSLMKPFWAGLRTPEETARMIRNVYVQESQKQSERCGISAKSGE